jgi:hypothetical protein
MQVDIIQWVGVLNRTKRWRRSLLELGPHLLLPSDMGTSSSWAFGLELSHTISFPGPPACRWQIFSASIIA